MKEKEKLRQEQEEESETLGSAAPMLNEDHHCWCAVRRAYDCHL
jgi:hypothetical protein